MRLTFQTSEEMYLACHEFIAAWWNYGLTGSGFEPPIIAREFLPWDYLPFFLGERSLNG